MSRKTDREICYQMLFSSLFLQNSEIDFDERLSLVCENTLDEQSRAYIKSTYEGILKNRAELESIVSRHLRGYEISGLYKTDLLGLLFAVYELKYNTEIPKKVVINEIVEICKKFSSPKSSQFVNGVLASVLKEMDNE